MKQFALILLVLSLLTGWSGHKELPEAPPDEKEAAQVPSDLDAPDSSLTPQFTLPVTEEALRTYYQAEEIDVQEILPCEGDFLVYGRTKAGGGVFHWVYGQTGVALPPLFLRRAGFLLGGPVPRADPGGARRRKHHQCRYEFSFRHRGQRCGAAGRKRPPRPLRQPVG